MAVPPRLNNRREVRFAKLGSVLRHVCMRGGKSTSRGSHIGTVVPATLALIHPGRIHQLLAFRR